MNLDLSQSLRQELLEFLWKLLDEYYDNTKEKRVSPFLNKKEIIDYVEKYKFDAQTDKKEVLLHVIEGLTDYAVHTPHPSYFGLFNPRASFAGILADLITATFNPQMAAWSHAPFAVEVENYLIREFASRFGYDPTQSEGAFCGGGAEANLTALLCAIRYTFPDVKKKGLLQLEKQPVIYVSAHSHHSVARAAVLAGLGSDTVRAVDTGEYLVLKTDHLKKLIQEDLNAGHRPFMVVATAGTTGPGTIDPLEPIAEICTNYNLWLHVDAAYGGAVALHPEFRKLLNGIEKSDSVTFDVHKWLSVPMAASLFITNRSGILKETFGMSASYMPKEGEGISVRDPYMHSIQWSRRFIGLKLYLSLLFYGWEGYRELVEHYMRLKDIFVNEIGNRNWKIVNHSPLPVVCFTIGDLNNQEHRDLLKLILEKGNTWLSIYPINGQESLRVCFNNYNSTDKEIYELIENIESAIRAI